jgi:tripeptidyl-peptidase I
MPRKFLGLLLNSYLIWCSQGENNLRSLNGEDSRSIVGQSSELFSYKGSIPRLSARNDLERQDRIDSGFVHEVVFVIQQRNMDEVTRMLHDVSDPRSSNYGQHMTQEQVTKMTENLEGRDYVVAYLSKKGASVTAATLGSEYITASAPISVWESMLNTQFYAFHQTQRDGKVEKLVRAEHYWIPKDLDVHVESVFNTIQVPYRVSGTLQVPKLIEEGEIQAFMRTEALVGYTTPAKIKEYYNVTTNRGSALSTQGVYGTISQYYSPSDLASFQVAFGLPNQPTAASIGGFSSDAKCVASATNCAEANLDVQYIMATSPDSPTTYWYYNLMFSDWLVAVAKTKNPPLVLSISYGADEAYMSNSEMEAFNVQAIKLGMMGVTIVAASGDDGAVSDIVRGGKIACGYSPLFPGSNPYVVSVGATAVSTGNAPVTSSTVELT